MARLFLLNKAYRHTGIEMYQAQNERTDKHRRAVFFRTEQRPQTFPCAVGIKRMHYLVRDVAEQAARQEAHCKRGYTAVKKKLAECL